VERVLHLFVVTDQVSLPSFLHAMDIIKETHIHLDLTIFTESACKLALQGAVAPLTKVGTIKIEDFYEEQLWDKSLSQADIVIDLRVTADINPVVLEAARMRKTLLIRKESPWSRTIIEQSQAGYVISVELPELRDIISPDNVGEKVRHVGLKWETFYQRTWDDILTTLLKPVLGGNHFENSLL